MTKIKLKFMKVVLHYIWVETKHSRIFSSYIDNEVKNVMNDINEKLIELT